MCFGAVYLDHHWVLDVLAGVAYCGLVLAAARAVAWLLAARSAADASLASTEGEPP